MKKGQLVKFYTLNELNEIAKSKGVDLLSLQDGYYFSNSNRWVETNWLGKKARIVEYEDDENIIVDLSTVFYKDKERYGEHFIHRISTEYFKSCNNYIRID